MKFDLTKIPDPVRTLHKILLPEKTYVVGGILRDLLLHNLNQPPCGLPDWDLATPLHPKEVINRLRHANITAVPIGFEHGTVAAVIDHVQYEITTFRHDLESTDGRHAVVRFSDSIEEDLQRRDFTINALALDLDTGELLDLFHGEEDLRHRIIRTVGDPRERFREDYLRMLRATRFAAKIEGTIETNTWAAIKDHAYLIKKISPERIRDEFLKMLSYPRPSLGFELMHQCGLLYYILPELEQGFGAWQNRFHADDVARHILYSVDAVSPKYPFIRFITLMHDLGKVPAKRFNANKGDYVFYGHQYVGKRMTQRVMRRLRFSNKNVETASAIVENHMYNLKADLSEGATRRFIRKLGRENIAAFLRMRMADRRGNRLNSDGYERGIFHFLRTLRDIDREENALKIRDLNISGYDLMKMGLQPGPIFRQILEQLLEEVLDEPCLNTRDYLLERASILSRQFNPDVVEKPAQTEEMMSENKET
ncbi:HD domain-containing protein [bacterium]|nr:HD domain-containing protein [bacterium]